MFPCCLFLQRSPRAAVEAEAVRPAHLRSRRLGLGETRARPESVPVKGAHRGGIQLGPAEENPLGLICPPLIELLRFLGNVLARLLPRLRFARRPALIGTPHGIFTLCRGLTG